MTFRWTTKARVSTYSKSQITADDITDADMEDGEGLVEDLLYQYGYDPEYIYNNKSSFNAVRRLEMAAINGVLHYLLQQGKVFYHSHVVTTSELGGGTMPPYARPTGVGPDGYPPTEDPAASTYQQMCRREILRFCDANDDEFAEMVVEGSTDAVKEAYGEIYSPGFEWVG